VGGFFTTMLFEGILFKINFCFRNDFFGLYFSFNKVPACSRPVGSITSLGSWFEYQLQLN
jgi:hypothetical protein